MNNRDRIAELKKDQARLDKLERQGWPLPASVQEVFFAANSVREAIDAIDERRYHDLWCDRMRGGFECNCSYGDPV